MLRQNVKTGGQTSLQRERLGDWNRQSEGTQLELTKLLRWKRMRGLILTYTRGRSVHTKTREDSGGRNTDPAISPLIKNGASMGMGGGGGTRSGEDPSLDWESRLVGSPNVGG